MFTIALRYWNTLRHLKITQIAGRIRFRFCIPRVDFSLPSPPSRSPTGHWQVTATRPSSMSGPTAFRFLNCEHSLPDKGGWDDSTQEKLWLYNLHYFDDLSAEGAVSRLEWHEALIGRWVSENPPGLGTGWEPYPLSLRIVNWVKWLAAGNAPVAGMIDSLALQARWLEQRLEWHLLGNHLFANAKALVFAGAYFQGAEADRWRAKGLRLVEAAIKEQVLPDGGNFERSPMYHAIFLEDVLDLLNLAGWLPRAFADTDLRYHKVAGAMLDWLCGMSHPDGRISFFNDAAFGIAPEASVLAAYAGRLEVRPSAPTQHDSPSIRIWQQSGYARLENAEATILLDVAPIGPDYLPGHAHADTLSFEMSLGAERIVVNGGTSRYGTGPERSFERGTAAHSTVQVAGLDSSEVWAGFRVARRARPFDLEMKQTEGCARISCSHDGYKRLAGRPVHRREWQLQSRSLVVEDSVKPDRYPAIARFILHPGVAAMSAEGGKIILRTPKGRTIQIAVQFGIPTLEPAYYAPEFGISVETTCLAVALQGGRARIEMAWGEDS